MAEFKIILKVLKMVERTRDELWYDYQAEVATPEGFQENPISFEEWLAIKGYCKNETRAGI